MEHFHFPNLPVTTPTIHSDHHISHLKAHPTSSPQSLQSPSLDLLYTGADMPSNKLATPAIACQTSPESASTSDEQPPIKFSTLMMLLRAASIINAKRMDGEVSIPRTALGEGQARLRRRRRTRRLLHPWKPWRPSLCSMARSLRLVIPPR